MLVEYRTKLPFSALPQSRRLSVIVVAETTQNTGLAPLDITDIRYNIQSKVIRTSSGMALFFTVTSSVWKYVAQGRISKRLTETLAVCKYRAWVRRVSRFRTSQPASQLASQRYISSHGHWLWRAAACIRIKARRDLAQHRGLTARDRSRLLDYSHQNRSRVTEKTRPSIWDYWVKPVCQR